MVQHWVCQNMAKAEFVGQIPTTSVSFRMGTPTSTRKRFLRSHVLYSGNAARVGASATQLLHCLVLHIWHSCSQVGHAHKLVGCLSSAIFEIMGWSYDMKPYVIMV